MGESKHNPKYNKNAYKYHREKLEAFGFNLPKGEKQIWKDYAASKGTTVTTMIKEYMRGCIEAEVSEYKSNNLVVFPAIEFVEVEIDEDDMETEWDTIDLFIPEWNAD